MPLERWVAKLLHRIHEEENRHLTEPGFDLASMTWDFVFDDHDDWVVLTLFSPGYEGYWIHPTLYPRRRLRALRAQLPHFHINLDSAAYGHAMSGGRHRIDPYWQDGKKLASSEAPMLLHRTQIGPMSRGRYFEFNQLVTHTLDLHETLEGGAFVAINDVGDNVVHARVVEHDGYRLAVIRRRALDRLLHIGGYVLVRYAVFQRRAAAKLDVLPSLNNTLVKAPSRFGVDFEYCVFGSEPVEIIEFRGAVITTPRMRRSDAVKFSFKLDENDEERYCEFTVYDWRHDRVLKRYSLDPKNFANYFVKSDLPYELSPVFFNAAVLDKYKHDLDRYVLEERRISCPGAWSLKTYDINEHNQVHTYAVYLGHLPYREQLHWLQYNEEPKGGISKRAYETDFQGSWSADRSPKQELRIVLERLAKLQIGGDALWAAKGGSLDDLMRRLPDVRTENVNAWNDAVLGLANAVIEGFQLAAFRRLATAAGVTYDEKVRTLGLLKQTLLAIGPRDKAESCSATLDELQVRRSRGKAHGEWQRPSGSLIEDARRRLIEVTDAISSLAEFLEAWLLARGA